MAGLSFEDNLRVFLNPQAPEEEQPKTFSFEENLSRALRPPQPTVPMADTGPGTSANGFEGQFMEGPQWGAISEYMKRAFGMEEGRYSREDIVDAYVTNMRRFNTGQSVVTVSELARLYQANDEDKMAYGNAYKVWDEANGVFSGSSNSTFAEKAEGVYDYARAVVVDPVNLLSLGVGKLFSMGSTKAASELAQVAISRAVEQAAKTAGSQGLTAAGRATAEHTAMVSVRQALARSTAPIAVPYQQVLRRAANREVIGTVGVEAAAASGLDYAYQQAMIESNKQEEYDPYQTLFAGSVSAIVGGAAMKYLSRGADATRLESKQAVAEAQKASLAARLHGVELAQRTAANTLNPSAVAASLSRDVALARPAFTSFLEKVRAGQLVASGEDDVVDLGIASRYFWLGSSDLGIEGVASSLMKGLDSKTAATIRKGDNFTNWAIETLKGMPAPVQNEVRDLFRATFGVVDRKYMTASFEDATNYLATATSDFGRGLAVMSNVEKKVAHAIANGMDANKALASEVADTASEEAAKLLAKSGKAGLLRNVTVENIQNKYIQTLVTHPGTSYLNAVGWAQMAGVNVAADTLRGTLYGGRALVSALAGSTVDSKTYAKAASHEFRAVYRRLSNLVNPHATYDDAMAYLKARPKARDELFRHFAGGVKVDVDEFLKGEGVLAKFQTIYGVRAIDFFSKTEDFMYNLDKQIRRKYGQSYQEFLQREDFGDLMSNSSSEGFKSYLEIESRAVQDTLRSVFSKSYKGNHGLLPKVAGVIEEARSFPLIGAMMPFGQFFNNTVALMADMSGSSIVHKAYIQGLRHTGRSEAVPRDLMELATKAAVGWSIAGYWTHRQLQHLDEGLAWDEERTETGAVVTKKYEFPASLFMIVGRVGAHLYRGEEVPAELQKVANDVFGLGGLSRGLMDSYGSISDTLLRAGRGEVSFSEMATGPLVAGVSLYASGFSRVMDPANQIIALSRGSDYMAIDRAQGTKWVNDSMRYTDEIYNLFERMVGVDNFQAGIEQKYSATNRHRTPAPIGRLAGYREIVPSSTIEKMFNDVDRPTWTTGVQFDNPETANIFRREFYPELELRAHDLVSSGTWDRMSFDQKQRAIQFILGEVKSVVQERLIADIDPNNRKAGLVAQIMSSGPTTERRREILANWGVNDRDVWTLTLEQLTALQNLMDLEKASEADFRSIVQGRATTR